jgi:transposase
MDMRAGTDTALARVVQVFGSAYPHTAYLFANRRATRRLHQGHFVWPAGSAADRFSLSRPQLDALVLGLPWTRIGEAGIITVV